MKGTEGTLTHPQEGGQAFRVEHILEGQDCGSSPVVHLKQLSEGIVELGQPLFTGELRHNNNEKKKKKGTYGR